MTGTQLNRRQVKALADPPRKTVYVFELPVRIVHWTVVLCLIVLSTTGLYIEHPIQTGPATPLGHPGFTLGEVRFIHELSAFVFIAAVLFRIYWSFAGNEYTHWRALLPVTRAQRRDLRDMLRFYTYLRRRPVPLNGHNPLAGLAYTALYALFIVTILTGLGLYAWLLRRPPWTTLFGWTYSVVSVPTRSWRVARPGCFCFRISRTLAGQSSWTRSIPAVRPEPRGSARDGAGIRGTGSSLRAGEWQASSS
jgi:Ni/Fe-hydrogenase b-type cytochrome subunit